MTDKALLLAMYERAGIEFRARSEDGDDFIEVTSLHSDLKRYGYEGFTAEHRFDSAGNLTGVAAWE